MSDLAVETDAIALTDDQYAEVVSWCHRWKCSYLADDYCGCSPDHLDREMADLLIEAVIEPIVREQREHDAMRLDSLHAFSDALAQMSDNLRAALDVKP